MDGWYIEYGQLLEMSNGGGNILDSASIGVVKANNLLNAVKYADKREPLRVSCRWSLWDRATEYAFAHESGYLSHSAWMCSDT